MMPNNGNGMGRRPFFSPGTLVLLSIMAVGYSFGLARLLAGLGAVTNLTDRYPWGIWIGIDVASGVALAAGGFMTAALINIFGHRKYHALERPALLTAWLGYTFVGIGLMFDLGRYYNIWHPVVYWQGNSVLFEVGMCVVFYLGVLTIEFSPTILEGLNSHIEHRGWATSVLKPFEKIFHILRLMIRRVMPIFLIAGVVLSFMHQSSLGSLMLIAPSKLSPLWWTPILPILFLLSAIMVGFPMVIFESIIAAKSFGKKPEMELLTPLSGMIPWIIAVYAVVKFGDLIFGTSANDYLANSKNTVALMVELGVGVVIPFFMLIQKTVRRSVRWLFIATSMIITGVALNRINVFVLGYNPPLGQGSYFPSFGEIAVTAALISTIIILYRFFAMFFPVMHEGRLACPDESYVKSTRNVPVLAWIARAFGVLAIIVFILVYVLVHAKAEQESHRDFRDIQYKKVLLDAEKWSDPIAPNQPTSFSPEIMPALLVINRQIANQRFNDYEPVRFMHKAHATRMDGQCHICHHRVRENEDDAVGVKLSFSDLNDYKPVSCVACHQKPGETGPPDRPGIMGAYHRQCIGCHEENTRKAPTDCTGCHHKHVPDHVEHIAMTGYPDPKLITVRCLECHEKQGKDILKTAHWKWEGLAQNTVGYENRTDLGKKNIINNYCVHVRTNEPRCSQCHIGYGWNDETFDFHDPAGIDCLVCHDTTGLYKKDMVSGGLPVKGVDIVRIAQNIGRPSRTSCGACHFYGGGGANVKHGDLEPALADPPDDFDVHMGKHNMRCQDCHTTKEHRIAGQCLAIPTSEGRVTCEQCHGKSPHALSGILAFHLDKHSNHVACQTCHIPTFAKETPTLLHWDWSTAGLDREVTKDQYGMPIWSKKKGGHTWGKNVSPCYTWYNGKHERYVLGDKIDPEETTVLNRPVGDIGLKDARIYPYKCYSALVPIDAKNKTLAVPNLWKGFWKHFDWSKALKEGMAQFGQPFSGEVGFARADMYWAINHEVVSADQALKCADCHAAKPVSCYQCHGADMEGIEVEFIGPQYPDRLNKWDFEDFGYMQDPVYGGGRFHQFPLPGTVDRPKEDESD